MRSILRKCAIGAVAVGGVLLVQPGNFANAVPAPISKCIDANSTARQAALKQLHKEINAASKLTPTARQTALQAAQSRFQTAMSTAASTYQACVTAARQQ